MSGGANDPTTTLTLPRRDRQENRCVGEGRYSQHGARSGEGGDGMDDGDNEVQQGRSQERVMEAAFVNQGLVLGNTARNSYSTTANGEPA